MLIIKRKELEIESQRKTRKKEFQLLKLAHQPKWNIDQRQLHPSQIKKTIQRLKNLKLKKLTLRLLLLKLKSKLYLIKKQLMLKRQLMSPIKIQSLKKRSLKKNTFQKRPKNQRKLKIKLSSMLLCFYRKMLNPRLPKKLNLPPLKRKI